MEIKGVPSELRRYAEEDADEIISTINKENPKINLSLVDISYDVSYDDENNTRVSATMKFNYGESERFQIPLTVKYDIIDDDVFYVNADPHLNSRSGLSGYIDQLTAQLSSGHKSQPIQSTTHLKNHRIVAADEDEGVFDEFDDPPRRLEREEVDDEIELESDEEEDEDSEVVDSDEVEPDDPNIEVENNIAEHYIAECSRCHGIFISAVMESDQEVESISGICPLCNKESDQYLRWVVKEV